MNKTIITAMIVIVIVSWSTGAKAGGAIVAGGKTNSAVLIYENKLDAISLQLILNELGKQLAMGKISAYGTITDEQGSTARCAQFGLLQTYDESITLLGMIAERAGATEAVRPVASCSFSSIN